jgi:proteasome lid subunit RPN8/RPN11
MPLFNFWPFVPWNRYPYILDIFIGDTVSYLGNSMYDCRKIHEIGTPFVCSSSDLLKKYRNVPKKHKFALNYQRYLEHNSADEFIDTYGFVMKERILKIIDEHGIGFVYGYCNSDVITSGVTSWLLSELKSDHIVKNTSIHLMLPGTNINNQLQSSTSEVLKSTGMQIKRKDIDSVVLFPDENNELSNLQNLNPISSCLEIIRKSVFGDCNLDISCIDHSFLRNNISTYGYATRKVPISHDLLYEYVEDITTRCIRNNFISADLGDKCRKAYFVFQIPRNYGEHFGNIRKSVINTARKYLPRSCGIHVGGTICRSKDLKIAGLFSVIKIGIAHRFIPDESPLIKEESASIPHENLLEHLPLPQDSTNTSEAPSIRTHAIIKSEVLDSIAIHALSCLAPKIKECYGTVYADHEGMIVAYHPVDSEEYTLRDHNTVKFTPEFYDHVRRLAKLYNDISLRLAGDNHSHPSGVPLQSNADMDFNKSFWKTDRNTCFITATGDGNGGKEWEFKDNEQEATKEIGGRLIKIRAYAGGTNTEKKLKIILKE